MLLQNLREEVAMDVDMDEDGMMAAKPIPNFGIEVDFESLDDEDREVKQRLRAVLFHVLFLITILQDNSMAKAQELDGSITKLNADIERMAPNMKAMRRYASYLTSDTVDHDALQVRRCRG
jgi:structural maintenance of chromosome 1